MGKSSRPTKAELEEDRFLEWIVEAGEYVKERARIFVAGAAALLLLIIVINYVQASRETAKGEAAALLGRALIAEANGQMEEGLRLSEQLVDVYPGTPAAAQGLVLLGNRYFSQGRYAEAEKLYQTYLDEYGDVDVLEFSAWGGIAACYESRGDYRRAATKHLEYVANHEGSMQSALALMDAARCYRLAGDTEREKESLHRITSDYFDSPVASRARDQLNML